MVERSRPQDWTPEWWCPAVPGGFVQVADEAKEELVHLVHQELEDRQIACNSHGYSTASGDLVRDWVPTSIGGEEHARLIGAFREKNRVTFEVLGTGEPNNDQIDFWYQVINAALQRLGTREEYVWHAVISEDPPHLGMLGKRLEAQAHISGLDLKPYHGPVVEDVRSSMLGFGAVPSMFIHWPVQVSGRTTCYDWLSEGEWRTTLWLSRITALLSLWWDSPWSARIGPRIGIEPDQEKDYIFGHRWRPYKVPEPEETLGQRVSVPVGLNHAEALLTKERRLFEAISIHKEGLSLQREHPSLALVSFIAAIEAVAQIDRRAEKCPGCECGKFKGCGLTIGSSDRFKKAVRSVLSESETSSIEDYYGGAGRSGTVHRGKLHGIDAHALHSGAMSYLTENTSLRFSIVTVSTVRKASRLLLLQKLSMLKDPEASQD
ncbi:hypothetical protein AB0K52_15240 [Glycomyces sp. NPDC049804]|uniref:hypothetical protein n=1 Tax=Glycomyces sp. NPDC049804 TaxID=3154363 RepID=UPI003428997C